MSDEEKSVNGWWDKMQLGQKQILRLMVQMLNGAAEGQALEVRRSPGQLKIALVDRPETKGEPDMGS